MSLARSHDLALQLGHQLMAPWRLAGGEGVGPGPFLQAWKCLGVLPLCYALVVHEPEVFIRHGMIQSPEPAHDEMEYMSTIHQANARMHDVYLAWPRNICE